MAIAPLADSRAKEKATVFGEMIGQDTGEAICLSPREQMFTKTRPKTGADARTRLMRQTHGGKSLLGDRRT